MRRFVECAACGVSATQPHLVVRDRLAVAPDERFAIVCCAGCGLLRLDPRPAEEELLSFYPEDYAPFERVIHEEPSALRRWMRRRYLAKRVREVGRFAPTPGRALDVGCATGLFLDALRARGWKVTGVEPSDFAARYARERLGLAVHQGMLDDAPFAERSFELITLWHVLEHLPDPAASLQRLRSLLVPGGVVALTVPNAGGWDARLWGAWWAGWDAPRHLYHFTPATLSRLLHDAGFQVMARRSFTDRHGMWVLSAAARARAFPTSRGHRLLYRMLATLPAQLLTYPYFLLAERANRSSAITLFARRPEEP